MKPSIPAILLRDLHKNYGKVRALQEVALKFNQEKFSAFSGRMAPEKRQPFAACWI